MEQLADIARLEERTRNLEEWQHKQNGTLEKLTDRINRIYETALAALISGIISLVLLALNLMKGKM